jgi:hypothetical protein
MFFVVAVALRHNCGYPILSKTKGGMGDPSLAVFPVK